MLLYGRPAAAERSRICFSYPVSLNICSRVEGWTSLLGGVGIMPSDNETNLQRDIQRYLDGTIALHQLEDSLVDELLVADAGNVGFAGAVHIAIAGLANGHLTEEVFQRELANAIRPLSQTAQNEASIVFHLRDMFAVAEGDENTGDCEDARVRPEWSWRDSLGPLYDGGGGSTSRSINGNLSTSFSSRTAIK
jgi:hypothetical protein